jgi:hypothetical protein
VHFVAAKTLRVAFGQDGQQQVLLGAEVVKQACFADPNPVGDSTQATSPVPMPAEFLNGGRDDLALSLDSSLLL